MLDPEVAPRNALSGVVRRFSWGITDQAVSSLTNFALGLLVARSVGSAELGKFALVFNTYLIGLTLSRVFSTDPLVIRFSACSERERRRASRAATGSALLIGLVMGAATALAGWAIGGSVGATFLVLAAMFPGLLVQDAWRFVFFARSKGGQAFLNDVIWGLVLIALFLLALSLGRRSVAYLTAAWGAAAGVAALVGVIQAKLVPAPWFARRWYGGNKKLSVPLFGEALTSLVAGNLGAYLVAAIAGLSALGALRAAAILLGPALTIVMGMGLVAVPEGARTLSESPKRLRRTSIGVSTASGLCVLGWGVAVFLLPRDVGMELVGLNWDDARALLIPMTLAGVASAAAVGAVSGLKALQAAHRILRTRMVEAVIAISSTVIGATWWGVAGVARAAAAGSTLIAVIWWSEFSKTLRERPAEQVGAP